MKLMVYREFFITKIFQKNLMKNGKNRFNFFNSKFSEIYKLNIKDNLTTPIIITVLATLAMLFCGYLSEKYINLKSELSGGANIGPSKEDVKELIINLSLDKISPTNIVKNIVSLTGLTKIKAEIMYLELIEEINFTIGGHIIQKFSGSYMQNLVERDFDNNKKELFNIMVGNISELNDPANYKNRNNNYPNAFKEDDESTDPIEPSISSHDLYIPLNIWFTLLSSMALPLICLQYAELEINLKLRPLDQLFTIKDVLYNFSLNNQSININNYDEIPRIHPSQNIPSYGFYRFIQEPPVRDISSNLNIYKDRRSNINMDIHLITTQCFLDNNERELFAKNTQSYLIKEVHEYDFKKINKSNKIKLETGGLVANWMWYLQRDDVDKRNEWSNYTNWAYENKIPKNMKKLLDTDGNFIYYNNKNNYDIDISKNIYITGNLSTTFEETNTKEILKDFAIICDGKYRENLLPSGVYNKIEKYIKTSGNSKEGIYNYNFGLTTDPFKYQPNGAFNTNKFKTIELEYNNYSNPPFDLSNVNFQTICDPDSGEIIATTKEPTSIYKYNYNLHIYEERYNILEFRSGVADLVYGR
mgnify:CR=1 FL=1